MAPGGIDDQITRELDRCAQELRIVEQRLALRADKMDVLIERMQVQIAKLEGWQAQVKTAGMLGAKLWAILLALGAGIMWLIDFFVNHWRK